MFFFSFLFGTILFALPLLYTFTFFVVYHNYDTSDKDVNYQKVIATILASYILIRLSSFRNRGFRIQS